MGQGHGLDGIGDQFPAGQRITHAGMPHGDAIAQGDGWKLHRNPPGGRNTKFDGLGDVPEMGVTRIDFVK